jgi:hypothetical protein
MKILPHPKNFQIIYYAYLLPYIVRYLVYFFSQGPYLTFVKKKLIKFLTQKFIVILYKYNSKKKKKNIKGYVQLISYN